MSSMGTSQGELLLGSLRIPCIDCTAQKKPTAAFRNSERWCYMTKPKGTRPLRGVPLIATPSQACSEDKLHKTAAGRAATLRQGCSWNSELRDTRWSKGLSVVKLRIQDIGGFPFIPWHLGGPKSSFGVGKDSHIVALPARWSPRVPECASTTLTCTAVL